MIRRGGIYAPAGFDAAVTFQQSKGVASLSQIGGSSGATRGTAYNNNVELMIGHLGYSPGTSAGDADAVVQSRMRRAITAAATNKNASNVKTAPKAAPPGEVVHKISTAAAPVRPPNPAAIA